MDHHDDWTQSSFYKTFGHRWRSNSDTERKPWGHTMILIQYCTSHLTEAQTKGSVTPVLGSLMPETWEGKGLPCWGHSCPWSLLSQAENCKCEWPPLGDASTWHSAELTKLVTPDWTGFERCATGSELLQSCYKKTLRQTQGIACSIIQGMHSFCPRFQSRLSENPQNQQWVSYRPWAPSIHLNLL